MTRSSDADGRRRADRRLILSGAMGMLVGGTTASAASIRNHGEENPRPMSARPSYFAYVGARTTRERNARGNGLNVYRLDVPSARWTHLQLVDGLANPSFMAFDRTGRTLLTVHGDGSEISAFRTDPSGRLTFLNRQSTEGKNPVHLAVSSDNRFVVVANHITCSLAVLPLRDDGSLGPVGDLVTLSGKIGPHRVEQPFPKPHQIQFDPRGELLAVPDKGLDETFLYRLSADGKLQSAGKPARAREGSGPRHISFHSSRPFAYVLNELSSTLTACKYDAAGGALTPMQTISTLPDTFCDDSRAAEIEVSPDGRFVYASNRGHDSIGIFSIDQASGRLTPVGWQASQGKTPRFFTIEPGGRLMLVANEDSDTIVSFQIDLRSGRLTPVGQPVALGSPVCIILRPMP